MFAKKLREDADFNEPTDIDTTKFRELGSLGTGFSSRFIAEMTNVNAAELLANGDLQDQDFDKDAVSLDTYRVVMVLQYRSFIYEIIVDIIIFYIMSVPRLNCLLKY